MKIGEMMKLRQLALTLDLFLQLHSFVPLIHALCAWKGETRVGYNCSYGRHLLLCLFTDDGTIVVGHFYLEGASAVTFLGGLGTPEISLLT